MNNERFNAYKVLGMHRGSTDADIKEAFRRACQELHPDRDTGNVQEFMKVTAAYHDIKNESKRNALAELMRFTAVECGECGSKGYKATRTKAGKVMQPCGACNGCGFVEKEVRRARR